MSHHGDHHGLARRAQQLDLAVEGLGGLGGAACGVGGEGEGAPTQRWGRVSAQPQTRTQRLWPAGSPGESMRSTTALTASSARALARALATGSEAIWGLPLRAAGFWSPLRVGGHRAWAERSVVEREQERQGRVQGLGCQRAGLASCRGRSTRVRACTRLASVCSRADEAEAEAPPWEIWHIGPRAANVPLLLFFSVPCAARGQSCQAVARGMAPSFQRPATTPLPCPTRDPRTTMLAGYNRQPGAKQSADKRAPYRVITPHLPSRMGPDSVRSATVGGLGSMPPSSPRSGLPLPSSSSDTRASKA